jgi:hypothetical protein
MSLEDIFLSLTTEDAATRPPETAEPNVPTNQEVASA